VAQASGGREGEPIAGNRFLVLKAGLLIRPRRVPGVGTVRQGPPDRLVENEKRGPGARRCLLRRSDRGPAEQEDCHRNNT